MTPPLPLHRLHQHRAGAVPDGVVEGGGIVVAAVPEASRQRLEALVVLRLRGGGHRGEGAAVEPVVEGHDLALLRAVAEARMLARELDRGLVRLRAGIAEEDPFGERRLAQLLGETHRRLHEVEVAGMPEPARLLRKRLRQLRVAVAERGHADPRSEVDVLVAVRVPYAGALAAVEDHLLGRVVGHVPALPRRHQLRGLRRLRFQSRHLRVPSSAG